MYYDLECRTLSEPILAIALDGSEHMWCAPCSKIAKNIILTALQANVMCSVSS